MALTSAQVDELVRAVAVRIGIDPDDPEVLNKVLDYDVEGAPTTRGLFTDVYGLVVGWISDKDAENHDIPKAGIEKSAWTFLRAAANVNFGDTLDAFMAREGKWGQSGGLHPSCETRN